MIYLAFAVFGAIALTFGFHGWLYLQNYGGAPVITVVVGAALGAGTAALFVATH